MSDIAKTFPYCNSSLSISERVANLVGSMTLEEKVSRMYSCRDDCDTCPCAVDRVGLPEYAYLLEANSAVAAVCLAPERCATVFVGPNGMGATFNRTAWRRKGEVISTEVRAFHNHGGRRGLGKLTGVAAYGPNININRDPRFGRNSELPGEDPFLSGSYAVEYVKGMQETDEAGYPRMVAYLKHFIAYNRETDRGSDDYAISQYDFADTYLPQYEMGMTSGAASGVMCSYNAANGVPSCANGWLLNEVLRKRWGREDAVVTSDGGAINNLKNPPARAPTTEVAAAWGLNNGTDINDGQAYKALPAAIEQGLTTEARLNEALTRALKQLFWAGLFDPVEKVSWTSIGMDQINSTKHQKINYDVALQSMVLLENNGILPLAPGRKIAVVGPQANGRLSLLSDYGSEQACWDGTENCIASISDAIAVENGDSHLTTSASGVDIDSDDFSGLEEALNLANNADVVVLALGTDKGVEGEGHDRPDTNLPGLQEAFALRVLELGKPTVLVLVNGGTLSIDSLVGKPAAVIEAFNPATAGASALAAQLFGRENRWGKLPATVYPTSFNHELDLADFDMTKSPGRTYRYYTGKPLWSFGTGLSLTTFALKCKAPTTAFLGVFSCEVENVGDMDGDEVVLAFHRPGDQVRAHADHTLPLKRLVGFERVRVAKGATETVQFEVTRDTLALTTNKGTSTVYAGMHELVFWKGNGEEQVFQIDIEATEHATLI